MNNREIDALIAEKVFNLPIQRVQKAWTDEDWMMSDNPTELNCMAIVNLNWKPGDIAPPARCIFDYSTDISAAWQVVEKINSIKMDTEEDYQIRAKFILSQDVKHFLTFSAQQAALRICLAALKAVGVEIK